MNVPVYVELNNDELDFLVRLMASRKDILADGIRSGALTGDAISDACETIKMMSNIVRSFTDGLKMTTEVIEEMGGK